MGPFRSLFLYMTDILKPFETVSLCLAYHNNTHTVTLKQAIGSASNGPTVSIATCIFHSHLISLASITYTCLYTVTSWSWYHTTPYNIQLIKTQYQQQKFINERKSALKNISKIESAWKILGAMDSLEANWFKLNSRWSKM